MGGDHLLEIVVDLPDRLIAAVHPQRVRNNRIENLLLRSRVYRGRTSEHIFHKLRLQIRRLLRVVEKAMYVRLPVIESREQKSRHGISHQPVPGTVLNVIVLLVVAEPRF